jgi:hypothetical protein
VVGGVRKINNKRREIKKENAEKTLSRWRRKASLSQNPHEIKFMHN